MLEPRDNFGTGAVALPGRNIFAPPAATNSDERARNRKVFDAAAVCQPTAVSQHRRLSVRRERSPTIRGLRLLVVLAFLLLAGAGAAPLVINLMGASSGRGISAPTPAPPPRLSAPPHHSPVAARPPRPRRIAISRRRHQRASPGPSPNATASPPVGGDRDGRYRAGQSLLRRYLRTRLRRCGVRRPSRCRSRRGRFRSRARCRPVPRPSSCDPRRLLMALDPKSRNTAVLAASALAVLATVVAEFSWRRKIERLISTREIDTVLRHPVGLDLDAILENREVLMVAGGKASVGEDNTVLPRGRVAGSLAAPLDPRECESDAARARSCGDLVSRRRCDYAPRPRATLPLLVSMKEGWLSMGSALWASGSSVVGCVCERRSSLYCLLGGRTRRHWRPASGAQFQKGRQAARRKVAPPEAGVGAKGWLLVSMCQIASVSFLAMSIWATLAPRWLPEALLVALVALGVGGVAEGVHRGLEHRPAQVLGALLGQRAAAVLLAGLVHARAQPGVAAQLLGDGEAGDVADLGGDRERQHPADPGHGQQQRHVWVIGARGAQLAC